MRLVRAARFMSLLSLIVIATMVVAACGTTGRQATSETPGTLPETGSGTGTDTVPGGTITDTDTITGTGSTTGTMPGGSGSVTSPITSTSGMTNEATIELTAEGFEFSTAVITATAGSLVVVEFTNKDNAPHNLAIYTDESLQEQIFVGEIVTGPDATVRYEFYAPSNAGVYYFQCDVHPEQMTGQFVVQQ